MGNIVERAYERIHMGKDFDPSFVRELIAYLYMSTGESRRNALRWSAAWKEKATELYRLIKILGRSGCEIKKIDGDHYNVRYPVVYLPEKGLDEAQQVARRLLRERDEARAEIRRMIPITEDWLKVIMQNTKRIEERAILQSQVNHLESDRDALAKQCDELRGALEQVEWVEGKCPWCRAKLEEAKYDTHGIMTFTGRYAHAPDCIRQKALGKA